MFSFFVFHRDSFHNKKIVLIIRFNSELNGGKGGIDNILADFIRNNTSLKEAQGLLSETNYKTTSDLISKYATDTKSVDDYAKSCGGLNSILKDYLETAGDTADMKDFESHVRNQGEAFGFATVKAKALSIAVSAGVTAAVIGATYVISSLAQANQKAYESAHKLAEEYRETESSVSDYKDQIKELRTSLDSNTLSYDESKDARSQLLSIQEELIDSYGSEANGIDLVNGKLSEQYDILNKVSETKYQQWEDESKGLSFWQNVENFMYSGMNNTASKAARAMVVDNITDPEAAEYASKPAHSAYEQTTFAMNKEYSTDYSGNAGNKTEDAKLGEIYSSLSKQYDFLKYDKESNTLKLIADNADTAYERVKLLQGILPDLLKDAFPDSNISSKITKQLQEEATTLSSTISKYGEDDSTMKLHTLQTDEAYKEMYTKALDYQDTYNTAIESGNADLAESSKNNLISTLDTLYDTSVAKADDVSTELDKQFGAWIDEVHYIDFEFKLNHSDVDIDGDKNTKEAVKSYTDKSLKLSDEDYANFDNADYIANPTNYSKYTAEQIAAMQKISTLATNNNMTQKGFVELLKQEGYIQSENEKQLYNYNQELVTKFAYQGGADGASINDFTTKYDISGSEESLFNWKRISEEVYKTGGTIEEAEEKYITSVKIANQITEDMEQSLSEFSSSVIEPLSKIQGIYKTFIENKNDGKDSTLPLSITDVEGLRESLVETADQAGITKEQFDDFEKIVTSSFSSSGEIQDAFDEIYTSFTKATLKASNYSEETKNVVKTQLMMAGATQESANAYVDYLAKLSKTESFFDKNGTSGKIEVEEDKAEKLGKAYDEAVSKREKLYSGNNYVGNVDINNRPVVTGLEEGSYSTSLTEYQEYQDKDGNYKIIHYTPILPNGEVLSEEELNKYISEIISSGNELEADNVTNGGKGIVYKVDTEVNGQKITDGNLQDAFGLAEAWDESMHDLQDKIYGEEGELQVEIDAQIDNGVSIENLLKEGEAAGYDKQAIIQYYYTKKTANGLDLMTSDSILQLANELAQLGYNTEALYQYGIMKQNVASIDISTPSKTNGNLQAQDAANNARRTQMNVAKQQLDEQLNKTPTLDMDAAAAAGKDGADAYLEAFKKELSNLDDLKDQGKITEKEYLDQLRLLYNKYFKDKKKYAKEYAEYEHKYLDGVKSLYDSVFDIATKLIDKQIDKLNEQKQAEEDSLQAQKDQLEAEKESIQDKIDLKQKEIDAIEQAAETRQKELDVQKAAYEFERSKNQLINLTYSDERGMHYEADTSDVQDKGEALEDAKREKRINDIQLVIDGYNEQIDAIEEQESALEKSIETSNKYFEDLIAGLEKTKTKWEELSEITEQAEMLTTLQSLGYTESQILNMSDAEFTQLKTTYMSVLSDMYSGNTEMINQLSTLSGIDVGGMNGYLADTAEQLGGIQQIDLSPLSESVGGVTDSVGKLTEGVGSASNALVGSGGGDEETTDKEHKVSYQAEDAKNNAKNQKGSTNGTNSSDLNGAIQTTSDTGTSQVPLVTDVFDGMKTKVDETKKSVDFLTDAIKILVEESTKVDFSWGGNVSSKSSKSSGSSKVNGTAHAEGTANVRGNWSVKQGGRSLVGELGQELVVRNGRFFTVGDNGAEMVDIQAGDILFNHVQTASLLQNGYITGRGNAYANGSVNSSGKSLQDINPEKYGMLTKLMNSSDSVKTSVNMLGNIERSVQRMSNVITNISNVSNANSSQNVVIEKGAITLNGVNDVSSLANAIVKQLPNKITSEIAKR